MSRPESDFPTINDMRAILDDLAKDGFGSLPVQLIMAPASTMQALAMHYGAAASGKEAAMIEMTPDDNAGRIPVCIVSAEGLAGVPASTVQ